MLSLESILLYFAKIRKKIKSTKEFGRFLKRGRTLIISTTLSPSFQKEGKCFFRPDGSKRPLVERDILRQAQEPLRGRVPRGLFLQGEDEG